MTLTIQCNLGLLNSKEKKEAEKLWKEQLQENKIFSVSSYFVDLQSTVSMQSELYKCVLDIKLDNLTFNRYFALVRNKVTDKTSKEDIMKIIESNKPYVIRLVNNVIELTRFNSYLAIINTEDCTVQNITL